MDFLIAEGSPVTGELTYWKRWQSFDLLVDDAQRTSAVGELVYGSIVLHVSRVTGDVVRVCGHDPDTSWESVQLVSPTSRPARLRVEPAEIPPHGIAERLLEDEQVKTQRDPGTGWIRVGRVGVAPSQQRVEFATGCLAELDGAELVALWLHPRMHSGDPNEATVHVMTGKAEVSRMLVEALAPFRGMSYSELAKRASADNCVRYQVTGSSATRYNVQIQVAWGGRSAENVRVVANVDDGTVASVIHSQSDSFIMAADGHFIGK